MNPPLLASRTVGALRADAPALYPYDPGGLATLPDRPRSPSWTPQARKRTSRFSEEELMERGVSFLGGAEPGRYPSPVGGVGSERMRLNRSLRRRPGLCGRPPAQASLRPSQAVLPVVS